jgi:uncharacterized protein YyaL (SSP411 family)
LRQLREAKRSPPALDDKILTAWNGLMIRGLAVAGKELQEPRYVEAAQRAATFLLANARDPKGRLTRSWREGRAQHAAVLDDYAFLAHGLLALRDATGDEAWRKAARGLLDELDRSFRDERGGYYLTANDGEALITRVRDPFDNATPAGVGIAAQAWAELARLGEPGAEARARDILAAFRPWILRAPQGCQSLLLAHRLLVPPVSAAAWSHQTEAFHLALETTTLRPGKNVLTLTLRLEKGWHVNAHRPGNPLLIPTTVTGQGLRLDPVDWPEGEDFRVDGLDEAIRVYGGELRIPLALEPETDLEPSLAITLQACDERQCLAPQTIRVKLGLAR